MMRGHGRPCGHRPEGEGHEQRDRNGGRDARTGGPVPHAVVANGFVYVSGQGPVDPETGSAPDGFEHQVHQAFENLRAILEAARSGLGEVVKVNAYLTDLTRFGRFDEVYGEYFAQDPPARTTVGAELLGIPVEVDRVAVVRGSG